MRARELLRHLGDADPGAMSSAQLGDRLMALVRAGTLPAGVTLPSERDLASALGRSRGTIARAYERLRSDGLAHTRHGAGTTIGCCAGPWASSRAAELVPIVTPTPARGARTADVIDLRRPRWDPPPTADGIAGGSAAPDAGHTLRGDVAARLAAQLTSDGMPTQPDQLLLTGGLIRAVDVALAALLHPKDRVLVPALTDPAIVELLTVRGFRPVTLPVDTDGRPDLPGWLRRMRSGVADVALLAATHAPPGGATLELHERRLLVEAATEAGITLVDDLGQGALWLEEAPPPPLAVVAGADEDRTITVGCTCAFSGDTRSVGWLRTTSAPVAERLQAVVEALDAGPSEAVVGALPGAFDQAPATLERRRQQLVDHVATVIRLLTPVAPALSVAPSRGGPRLWIGVRASDGTGLADAARERGVLVEPGSACVVGDRDPQAITLALTVTSDELVTGVRVLADVARSVRHG